MFIIIGPPAFGQDTPDRSSTFAPSDRSTVNQPTEETVFDTKLPETQEKGVIEISLSPRFADAFDNDWIRYRTRLKYGLSENLETSVTFDSFSDNPFRSNGESGLSELTLWTKYRFDQWAKFPRLRISTGLDLTLPIGNPPTSLSDQYFHIKPFLVFSRFLLSIPSLESFMNIGFDITSNPPHREQPARERPEHSMGFSVGGIYYWWENVRHSLDLSYRTTEIGGGNSNDVFFDMGLLWRIPYSFFGIWQVGGGVRVPLTDIEEKIEVFTRVKWDMNLKMKVRLKNREII